MKLHFQFYLHVVHLWQLIHRPLVSKWCLVAVSLGQHIWVSRCYLLSPPYQCLLDSLRCLGALWMWMSMTNYIHIDVVVDEEAATVDDEKKKFQWNEIEYLLSLCDVRNEIHYRHLGHFNLLLWFEESCALMWWWRRVLDYFKFLRSKFSFKKSWLIDIYNNLRFMKREGDWGFFVNETLKKSLNKFKFPQQLYRQHHDCLLWLLSCFSFSWLFSLSHFLV